MKKITSILLLFVLVLINACNNNDDPLYDGPAEKTILVYLAANHNLAPYARDDIQEMILGMANIDPNRHNLVILESSIWGTGNNPQLYRLIKNKNGEVIKDIINEYEKESVIETDFMISVFKEVFSAYPADKYALVLWSHADGWLEYSNPSTRYAATDDLSDPLNIFDLKKVLQTAPHFEYIYYESCFMSSFEALYELRSHADYFIACPTETPGPGAPYDLILEAMFAKENAPERLAKIYCDYYLEKYTGTTPTSRYNWNAGAALTVIRTNAMDELTAATAGILANYARVENGEISRDGLVCYDPLTGKKLYYDLDQVIKRLTGGNSEYQNWRTVFDKAVIYYSTTPKIYSGLGRKGMITMENTQGLSFYLPRGDQDDLLEYYKEFEWYKAGGWQAAGW